MTDWLIPAATLAVGAGLTFAATWFWKVVEKKADELEVLSKARAALLLRVSELEKQLAIVQVTVVPISAAYQAMLVKQLTHFHTPELDALLVKLGPPSALDSDEAQRMAVLLQARTIDMGDEIDDSERDAAAMLPMVVRRVAEEVAAATGSAMIQTVSIPKEKPEVRPKDEGDLLKDPYAIRPP